MFVLNHWHTENIESILLLYKSNKIRRNINVKLLMLMYASFIISFLISLTRVIHSTAYEMMGSPSTIVGVVK